MTRKEAINFLKGYLDEEVYTENCRNAHEMAIKALEQEPCEDCISRQAVLKELKESAEHHANNSREKVLLLRDRDIIRAFPPVTPQPKMGQWIDIMIGDMPAQACNQCDTFYPLAYTGGGHNYCPNCGAKMEVKV